MTTFDRILVLVDGVIVEDGSPSRLRHSGGLFERLWQLQTESADEEQAEAVS